MPSSTTTRRPCHSTSNGARGSRPASLANCSGVQRADETLGERFVPAVEHQRGHLRHGLPSIDVAQGPGGDDEKDETGERPDGDQRCTRGVVAERGGRGRQPAAGEGRRWRRTRRHIRGDGHARGQYIEDLSRLRRVLPTRRLPAAPGEDLRHALVEHLGHALVPGRRGMEAVAAHQRAVAPEGAEDVHDVDVLQARRRGAAPRR